MPGPGKLTMRFEPKDGGQAQDYTIFEFEGAGVAMGMYNTEVRGRGCCRKIRVHPAMSDGSAGLNLSRPTYIT